MTKKEAVLPVLSSTSENLKSPNEIMEYIIRHYAYTPKNISDINRNAEISFRFDDALYSENPEELANAVEKSLYDVFYRYFPDADTLSVTVDIENLDDSKYNVIISTTIVIDGESYYLSKSLETDNEGNVVFNI